MPKKNRFDWGVSKSDDTVHHIEDKYAWAYEEDSEANEEDESYGAEDYVSSRPWGIDNDG